MKCPKCLHEQDAGLECVSCGIIIAKYLGRQQNPTMAKRAGSSTSLTKKTKYRRLQIEKELRSYYQSQYVLLKAGINSADAHGNFLAEPGEIKDRLPFIKIEAALGEGLPVSEGMRRSESYFPAHHTKLIEAGEHSGNPAAMFEQLRALLDQRIRIIETIFTELRKPSLTLLCSIFILPLPTLISDGVVAYLVSSALPFSILLLVVYSCTVAFSQFMTSDANALLVHKKLFDFMLYRQFQMNRFVRVFTTLYAAGITTAQAWATAASVSDNKFLQETLVSHVPSLESGQSLAQTARATGIFSSELLQVLNAGEVSGSLEASLGRYVEASENDFEVRMKTLTSRLTIVIGLIISIYVGYRIVVGYPMPEIASISLVAFIS